MGRTLRLYLKILLVCSTCITVAFGILILLQKTVQAISITSSSSWTDNQPVVTYSASIANLSATPCKTVFQTKDIAGETESQKVCIQASSKINFGVSYYNGRFTTLINFKYDSKMYRLNGPCYGYDNCLYLPESDTLVTRQYIDITRSFGLLIYKNFSHRLNRIIKGITPEYNLDTSNPDYIFQSTDGYVWPINRFNASNNGKWLAVEFRQRGTGVLDMETFQMKRISTQSFRYDVASDPQAEMAVSNDGQHLMVTGINSGFAIYDDSTDCGDIITDIIMREGWSASKPCKQALLNPDDLIVRFYAGIRPRFNDAGDELNFYLLSYIADAKEITLRTAGYIGQRLDYLALGDSFTSGEGETDDKYYLPGTNDDFEKCHLSTRSYPYLVARLSNISPVYMKSVACSGAVTDDIIGGDSSYKGQGGRLGADGLRLSVNDLAFAKTNARYNFIPGRVHQATFSNKYRPKVITIGIGGNDSGLMDKLNDCVGLVGTCDWAADPIKKEQVALEIKQVYEQLVQTYTELSYKSPNSRIYAIGYPKIIDSRADCGTLSGMLFNQTERIFMNESVIYLNQVVAAAAKTAGIKYIDVQDVFGNQVLCGSASPSVMNGVRFGDDINLVNKGNYLRFIGNESFHPNPNGHILIADAILKSVINPLYYSYCEVNVFVCPDSSVTAPEPSSYWFTVPTHSQSSTHYLNFVTDRGPVNGLQKRLTIFDQSLQPDSIISVEITSDPQRIGQFKASNDGGMVVDIDLPNNLEEGFHTIHLYGMSYSGEMIELYQIIKYLKPITEPVKTSAEKPATVAVGKNSQSTSENIEPDNITNNENDVSHNSLDSDIKLVDLSAVKGASTKQTSKNNLSISAEPDYQVAIITAVGLVLLAGMTIYLKRK